MGEVKKMKKVKIADLPFYRFELCPLKTHWPIARRSGLIGSIAFHAATGQPALLAGSTAKFTYEIRLKPLFDVRK